MKNEKRRDGTGDLLWDVGQGIPKRTERSGAHLWARFVERSN